MFFVGIDIGKRNHKVALLVDDKGKTIGKTLRFPNTKHESEQLLRTC
ncbi:MAG: IS110 family transposase [Lactobacillales bacterium]|jgi:activator of 2-hydroxyglutaryl-CoA dehydratase|nr:IS110 family transposase [Lactobacillales bacterium]